MDASALIDEHLAGFPEPQRRALQKVRESLLRTVPEAQEAIKYRMPAITLGGVGIAAYDGFKAHNSYFPMSGGVLAAVASHLDGYDWSGGTLRFAVDRPLPIALIRVLVRARREEIARRSR